MIKVEGIWPYSNRGINVNISTLFTTDLTSKVKVDIFIYLIIVSIKLITIIVGAISFSCIRKAKTKNQKPVKPN